MLRVILMFVNVATFDLPCQMKCKAQLDKVRIVITLASCF